MNGRGRWMELWQRNLRGNGRCEHAVGDELKSNFPENNKVLHSPTEWLAGFATWLRKIYEIFSVAPLTKIYFPYSNIHRGKRLPWSRILFLRLYLSLLQAEKISHVNHEGSSVLKSKFQDLIFFIKKFDGHCSEFKNLWNKTLYLTLHNYYITITGK